MQTNPADCLTYLIPTHNRPEFLQRLLRYMATVGCRSQIRIADSSHPQMAAINLATFQQFRSMLRLTIQHYDLGVIQKCNAAVAQVSTAYAAFVADDDFQFPQIVDNCTQFLQRNSDFGTCLGRTAIIRTGSPTVRLLDHRPIDAECPLRRYFEMSLQGNYSTFYGVHRTSFLRQRFQWVADNTDYQRCRILPEIMLAQLCAIQGKIGTISETSLLKLSHEKNETVVTPRVQNPSQATAEYERYREAIRSFVAQTHPEVGGSWKQRLVDRNFRLMYPAPLGGGLVLINRLRREARKLKRHATRSWNFGVGYLSEQKGYHLPTKSFASVSRQQALAVEMVHAAPSIDLPKNQAA